MGAIPRLDDLKTAELHDTAIARAARAEIARRAARLSERAADRSAAAEHSPAERCGDRTPGLSDLPLHAGAAAPRLGVRQRRPAAAGRRLTLRAPR
ncbi:hypothetical protein [Candidatus Accumulibacter contiguus]|jgi:hypothetical protein|uniref:hypothetical protein n=1 Tax=Candidatus Accumulibacter contiguus TaxID=2954381 RepID=UPI002FC28D2D